MSDEQYPTVTRTAIKDMKMALGCYDNEWWDSGHGYALAGLEQLIKAVEEGEENHE